MTAEELMSPRFKVITDYPGNDYSKIGDIFEPDSDFQEEYILRFPHLFQKLNWWEHRKVEDMPKKLISRVTPDNNDVFEIEEWDMKNMIGWVNKKERECCDLCIWTAEYGYFPVD